MAEHCNDIRRLDIAMASDGWTLQWHQTAEHCNDIRRPNTAMTTDGWALQWHPTAEHCNDNRRLSTAMTSDGWTLQWHQRAEHCNDIRRIDVAITSDGWTLQLYQTAGHCNDIRRLDIAMTSSSSRLPYRRTQNTFQRKLGGCYLFRCVRYLRDSLCPLCKVRELSRNRFGIRELLFAIFSLTITTLLSHCRSLMRAHAQVRTHACSYAHKMVLSFSTFIMQVLVLLPAVWDFQFSLSPLPRQQSWQINVCCLHSV